MSKLVTILGPTATGKTELGVRLAQKFDGEVVCADSRTIYRYMDIGTAKPSLVEMMQIPHHLLEVVNPSENFSAAEFKQLAVQAIGEISDKGKLPLLVGGSGLYIDSVLYDYQFPAGARNDLRIELESKSIEELVGMLKKVDPEAAEMVDLQNPRRVIRAIETAGQPRFKAKQMRPETLVLGLTLNKEIMQKRIVQRAQKMLDKGIINETKRIGDEFGWDIEALNSPGYRAIRKAILECHRNEDLADQITTETMQLAKKQMTWFKRNKDIIWLDAEDSNILFEDSAKLVQDFLAA